MSNHNAGQKLKENISFSWAIKLPADLDLTEVWASPSWSTWLLGCSCFLNLRLLNLSLAWPFAGNQSSLWSTVPDSASLFVLCSETAILAQLMGPESKVKGEPSKLFNSLVAILGLTLLTSSHSSFPSLYPVVCFSLSSWKAYLRQKTPEA